MLSTIQGISAIVLLALLMPVQAAAFSRNDPKIADDEAEDIRTSALSAREFNEQGIEYNILMDELEAQNPDRFYNLKVKPGYVTLEVDICKSCRPQALRLILKQKPILSALISMSDSKLNPVKKYRFRPGIMANVVPSYAASARLGRPVSLSMGIQVHGGEYMFAAGKEVQEDSLGDPKSGPGIHVDRSKIAMIYHLVKKFHSTTVITVR